MLWGSNGSGFGPVVRENLGCHPSHMRAPLAGRLDTSGTVAAPLPLPTIMKRYTKTRCEPGSS